MAEENAKSLSVNPILYVCGISVHTGFFMYKTKSTANATVPFCLFDFHNNFFVSHFGRSFGNSPESPGNLTVFSDNHTHIVLGNM